MIMIMLIISLVLSFVISHLRSPFARKLVTTLLGLALTTYTYGLGVFLMVAFNVVGYLCMALAPRKYCNLYVIGINGFWLTANNVLRMVNEDTGYGVITLCMICFVKQTIISANYRDGGDYSESRTSREKKYAL